MSNGVEFEGGKYCGIEYRVTRGDEGYAWECLECGHVSDAEFEDEAHGAAASHISLYVNKRARDLASDRGYRTVDAG